MKLLLTGSDGFVGTLLKRHRPCVPLMDDGRNVDLRDADRLGRAIARIAPDAVSSPRSNPPDPALASCRTP